MNCKRMVHQIYAMFNQICHASTHSSRNILANRHTMKNNMQRKWKKKPRNESKEIFLKNEVLFGRFVCNITLKMSRRSVFRLHLLKSFESLEIEDKKVIEIITVAQERRIPIEYHVRTELDEMSKGEPHQGICLEVGEYVTRNFDESQINSSLSSKRNFHPLWILLTGTLDPWNVGSILRSCFYFNVDMVLIDQRCAPITPVVSKASCGAVEILNLFTVNSVGSVIEALKSNNWDVIGTVANNVSVSGNMKQLEELSAARLQKPSLIIYGNEGSGIPDSVLSMCTRLLTISCQMQLDHIDGDNSNIRNMIGCLNVSNAAAVTLYELHRKRLKEN